ncbi:hypothetical protein SERLA73DRAFT_145564 [Serpula lacrymans var. lacrymans S7.3]|uniref:DUF6533 domain-containing protein n=1 Tax=Serpula lacrymans var. lacrymans (strain S7.3) TaxID=936435 RepID=F8QE48_SERL3|nr:hypothetical protein SERLA73DRAFT_145564 [Serpula lacrymans var. lacrymans S7.3]
MAFTLNRNITPEELLADTQIMRNATWTRYLSLAGLVVLLYDHTLTFGMEVQFMWKSTPNQTATKILFLCNRYFVPVVLLVLAHSMCGFLPVEHHYDDKGCAILMTISSSLAIISMGVENFLILTRVTALWDHNKMATRLMLILYTLSYGCTVITSVITILHISDGFVYSRVGRLCVSTKTSPELVAIWIAPVCKRFSLFFYFTDA